MFMHEICLLLEGIKVIKNLACESRQILIFSVSNFPLNLTKNTNGEIKCLLQKAKGIVTVYLKRRNTIFPRTD